MRRVATAGAVGAGAGLGSIHSNCTRRQLNRVALHAQASPGGVTVKLTQTLEASDAYGDALDAYLNSAADTYEVNAADWAYVRWGTAVSLVRHQASAALSAVVTRGLVEEAIRWDWSAATGRLAQHNQASAARELHGLRMKGIDFEWLIRPGGRIELRQPFRWLEDRELSSHARIMGSQLDPVAIDQLSAAAFQQLKTVLDGYAHSSPLAGFALFESGGYEPSDELAALILQLAAASATVIGLTAVQGSATLKDVLLTQTQAVSAAATVVHGIRVSPTQSAGTPPSLRRGTEYPPVVRASKLVEPTGPTAFHHWAIGELLPRLKDVAVELAVHRLQLPLQIRGLRAVAEGHLGSVAACIEVASASLNDQSVGELIPLGARLALEAGAGWCWVLNEFGRGNLDGQRAYLHEASRRIRRLYEDASQVRVDESRVDRVLGEATWLRNRYEEPTDTVFPTGEDLLAAYGPWYGSTEVAVLATRAYAVLSQFVHGTTLGRWQIVGASGLRWTTVSEPIVTVGLASLSLGFLATARAVIGLRAVDHRPHEDLLTAVDRLSELTGLLLSQAAEWLLPGAGDDVDG